LEFSKLIKKPSLPTISQAVNSTAFNIQSSQSSKQDQAIQAEFTQKTQTPMKIKQHL
jgi:hypothetical protein